MLDKPKTSDESDLYSYKNEYKASQGIFFFLDLRFFFYCSLSSKTLKPSVSLRNNKGLVSLNR